MNNLKEHTLQRAINHHIENSIPIYENIFRPHSDMSNKLFLEMKKLYENGKYSPSDWFEEEILNSDIGLFDVYENETVPLDYIIEDENVELNKPKRGGPKKFYVYVKDPSTGNVKKVTWGDTTGLKVKIDDPVARKSFAARHRCSQQNDKTTAAYWACRTPHYAASLGLSGGGKFFW
jgi:hypothetical protein